ncbi:hypothetical protein B0H14DRAFT_3460536 [Mycena olivaceomarginata]|nr:hypothetical protein B0H14DRAFT_3460536 [Mycena olivaceomarginata]
MHDLATPMHCSPPHSPTFLALSQPQPPPLSLHAELLELVLLHSTTRPPTQPSANTTLGIESHAQCKPMTGFLNVEAGLRAPAARPSLSTYVSSVPSPTLTSLRTILTSLVARLARRRACVHPAARRGAHVRRGPHLRRIAFHATDRMHTDRDLRPLLVEPPWSSSLTPPRTSREELQTTSCTPLHLMIVLGGHDDSGA